MRMAQLLRSLLEWLGSRRQPPGVRTRSLSLSLTLPLSSLWTHCESSDSLILFLLPNWHLLLRDHAFAVTCEYNCECYCYGLEGR